MSNGILLRPMVHLRLSAALLLLACGLAGVAPASAAPAHPSELWALRPLSSPAIPAVEDTAWCQTPIDFFILAKLEKAGLSPSPRAGKHDLIRRATYDLTGLPPTDGEVRSFLQDTSPEAFTRVVDRLLASPRYGERWGRAWLDVARYADTKGYVYSGREEARFVHSAAYRDWVIQAFNNDLPYDRFLVLQIAADQLVSGENRADLAAMGFLTLGRRFLGVVHDIIDDRIDVVMRGTQGLTVGCARCHDHKFDPISIQDYYALYGVFAGSTEEMVALPRNRPDPDATEIEAFEKGLAERTEKYRKTLEKKREEFSNRYRARSPEYLAAVLEAKKLPTEEHYEIRGPDDINPTVVRSWETFLLQTKDSFHPVFAPWHVLAEIPDDQFAERAPAELAALLASNTNRINRLVRDALTESPPASMKDVAVRYGQLLADVHHAWQQLLTNSLTGGPAPVELPDPDREELRQILYRPDSPAQIPNVAAADLEWYLDEPSRVELMTLHAEIERWIIKSPGAPPYAVILKDRPIQKNPRVFIRGNPAAKGEEVPRRFLEMLSGADKPFQHGSGRLELARAIADPANPLTARVMVNRIWLHHFGAGLVRTPSDFGSRSEPPSHPELLDWLSQYFISSGWSVKQIHRMIMLSSVYQQSSRVASSDPQQQENYRRAALVDPECKLLWRMQRHRLDFEMLRDSLLLCSGELDPTMGGPPVELFKRPFSTRRTVHGFIDRQFLPGIFRVFDCANPDMHSPQRPETTVPQQALFFMNSPFVVERTRALIRRPDIAAISGEQGKIERLYRILFQRDPTSAELEAGLRFLQKAPAAPAWERPKPPPPVWLYGYGAFDPEKGTVTRFSPLPHFSGEAWQGGPDWPDPALGWLRLTADGGHPGKDLEHVVIRRWVAPAAGTVTISGTVHHDPQEGDGIRATIVSARGGSLGSWTVHKGQAEAEAGPVSVEKGDMIDFVVDLNGTLSYDQFRWAPIVRLTLSSSDLAGSASEWNSKKDFSGPPDALPEPLSPWEEYAQVLLLSNEFLFVD